MRAALLVPLLLAASTVPLLAPAAAEAAPEVVLPAARQGPTATWVPTPSADCPDGCAYIFGGWRDLVFLKDIARFDPSTGTFEAMVATLPRGNFEGRAVWDGRDRPEAGCAGGCVYILGGRDGTVALNTILAYHPATDTLRTLSLRLPYAVWSSTLVWTGSVAYLFGGCISHDTNCATSTPRIVRFDPVAGTAQQLAAAFPRGRYLAAGAWDPTTLPLVGCPGGCAYLYGGWDSLEDPTAPSMVFRFDPMAGVLEQRPILLSEGRGGGVGLWHDGAAWVLGGCTTSDGAQCGNLQAETAAVDRNVPSSLATSTEARPPLAVANFHGGLAYDGTTAWTFGGCCPATDLVLSYAFPAPAQVVLGEASVPLPDLPEAPEVPDIGSVNVHDDGAFVCAGATLGDTAAPRLACVERLALGPADGLVPRQDIPLGVPVDLPAVDADEVAVSVVARHDPSQEGIILTLLDEEIEVPRPIEPTPGGIIRFVEGGNANAVRIGIELRQDGAPVGGTEVAVPWIGQVLGALGWLLPL